MDLASCLKQWQTKRAISLDKLASQNVLQLGACIGNNFPLKVLSYINGKDQITTLNELKEAIEEGVIFSIRGNMHAVDEHTIDANVYFKFLHDNVEQAAYSMISNTLRQWSCFARQYFDKLA